MSTPLGIYGAGNFLFVGHEFNFSRSIVRYNAVNEAFQGINSGVDGEVGSAAYINNYVVFSGSFTSVETLSLQSYLSGQAQTYVPHLVKVDSDNNFSLLEDPNNVYNCSVGGRVLATNDGSTLFIYCEANLYSWDQLNYFQHMFLIDNITSTLQIDPQNNLFALKVRNEHQDGKSKLKIDLSFFNATTDYSESTIPVLDEFVDGKCVGFDTSLARNEGILVAINLDDSNCETTYFVYFNSITGQLQNATIPVGNFTLNYLMAGGNNDLWAYSMRKASFLNYYSAAQNTWAIVSLQPVEQFLVESIVWDTINNHLLVYLIDYTKDLGIPRLVQVRTDVAFPPNGSTILDVGPLTSYGVVEAIATVKQTDAEDYDVYVGGLFEYAGNGVVVKNLAKYSSGSWTPVNTKWTVRGRIVAMTAYSTSLFYAPSVNIEAGDPLPFDVIDTITGNSTLSSMFAYIPTCYSALSLAVSTFYIDDSYVYVAGQFQVVLPSGQLVSDLVIYDKQNQVWFGIGIPEINSAGINTVTVQVFNGQNILFLAGNFVYNIAGNLYDGLAYYNLDTSKWIPPPHIYSSAVIFELLVNNTGTMFMCGQIYPKSSEHANGLESYNFISQVTDTLGALQQTYVKNMLLYTFPNYTQSLFAASYFEDANENSAGFLSYPLSGGSWTPAGQSSILYDYFLGIGSNLLYKTGGKGLNGIDL